MNNDLDPYWENIARINHDMFTLQMNRKRYTACNFNCRIESEGLLKLTVTYSAKVFVSGKWC